MPDLLQPRGPEARTSYLDLLSESCLHWGGIRVVCPQWFQISLEVETSTPIGVSSGMRANTTMARVAGQQFTALLLLIVSLLLPVSPLLQARGAAAEACSCCRRKGNEACRRSHAMAASGPSWNASPDCAGGCGPPMGLAFSAPFLSPETARAAGLLSRIAGLPASIPSYRASPSYAAWRYQRPPPLL